ncbi:hypothetical protein TPB0596_10050 [Tsukamurella pulmonis]|uniref:hypothetical protein n=1 Tax=Tsukamurella pulmonis TaxID=47312 RepID=UPI001EE01F40|nr:hypothetical protein [Tsukamurella pulmonis]BDD81242.1 hypothetical protein TPB0596_10050 [Tsukamurella pulmonis]
MNRKKVAATIAMLCIPGSSVAGCGEKARPLSERMFADVICMKVYTSGGPGANCSTVLSATSAELENCIPQNPPSPISSMSELARYCPSVAVRIANNSNFSASTAPTSAQGSDTNTGAENAAEAASEAENMSDLGDTVKTVILGIVGLVAVTILGFWIRARRDRQSRTAQRQHAAEHGWHS